MSRITLLAPSQMTDDQRRVYDATRSGRRGRVPAPLIAWLVSPALAERAQKLGEFVRYETTLPPRLSELAILLVAHHWASQYEWFAHEPEALKAGVDAAVVNDIAAGRRPRFEKDDERVVCDFVTTLHETRSIPEGLYRTTVAALGEQGVVELVGLLGYYTLISMTLNVFEIDAADAANPELKA